MYNFALAFVICGVVYFIGEAVSNLTKAWIPSVFVTAAVLLVGFWTVIPTTVVSDSMLIPFGSTIGIYLLITHMGTAKQGYVAAQYALGKLYLSDDASVHDPELGIQWLEYAAYNGNHDASYRLGKEYLKGESVRRDTRKAMDHIYTSAQCGETGYLRNAG